MRFIELNNCQIETTTRPCPVCGTLFQKISPKLTHLSFKEYYVCPNETCQFVGSRDVEQLEILLELLSVHKVHFADFTVDKIAGYAPLKVYFTENSFGLTINTWSWNFGDGQTGTPHTKLTSHEYSLPGNYTVQMQVIDSDGNLAVVEKENLIQVSQFIAPQALFDVDETSGEDSLIVNFTDKSIGSELTGWEWDFGDGSAKVYLQNPQHIYSTVGTFSVSLTAYNSRQDSNQIVKSNLIHIVYASPVVDFSANITSGYDPMTVEFTSTSQNYITNYLWDFGDGSTSTLRNPSHTYLTPGSFSVTLTVTNPTGQSTTQKENFIVIKPYTGEAVPNFTYSVLSTLDHLPISVRFTDLSEGCGIKSYTWDFGDGFISHDQNPIHNYLHYGVYLPTLSIVDWRDTTSSIYHDLDVDIGSPNANFSYDSSSNYYIRFNNLSTGDFLSYYWTFSDGLVSTEQNPLHQFIDTSNYVVTLQVSNPKGVDSTSIMVTPTE